MARFGPPALAALVVWTLLTWTTRLPLAWGDADLDLPGKLEATVPVVVFVGVAAATAVAGWRRSTMVGRVGAALAGWSIAYWAVRLPLILGHDHPGAFKAVHAGLAAVAVGLSTATLVALNRAARRTVSRARPAPEPAARG